MESYVEILKIARIGVPSAEIYRARAYGIGSISWSSDGALVFTDMPYEMGVGTTLIYHPEAGGIVQRLTGAARERDWNPQRDAMLLLTYLGIPVACDAAISGYDFVSDRPLPDIKPLLADIDGLLPVGSPVWVDGGRAAVLAVRPTSWDAEREDYLLGPAIALAFRLGRDGPGLEVLGSAPETDYLIMPDDSGGYSISSQPYQPGYCGEG